MWHGIGMQWCISLHLCTGTSHDMGMSAWYGSTLRLVFDGGLGTIGRRPTESHDCIHGNENMCRVIASKDRHPLG